MFCSLLLLGVKLGSLPSARLRKEIVKNIRVKQTKDKVKEAVSKRLRILNPISGDADGQGDSGNPQ